MEVDGKTVYDSKGFPVRDPKLRTWVIIILILLWDLQMILLTKISVFNFLWDWRKGGVFLSRTFSLGSTSGILESTLPGRETGIVGEGMVNVGTTAA